MEKQSWKGRPGVIPFLQVNEIAKSYFLFITGKRFHIHSFLFSLLALNIRHGFAFNYFIAKPLNILV